MSSKTLKEVGDYYRNYLESLPEKPRLKLLRAVEIIRTASSLVPETMLAPIKGVPGLFEIRERYSNTQMRVFCFFDQGSVFILGNGFTKKTQKTLQKEIMLAKRLMDAYFEQRTKSPGG